MLTNESGYLVYWTVPVRVRAEDGSRRSIPGPSEALDILNKNWTGKEGPHYLNAKRECAAAIERRVSAEFARDIFIAATVEAGLHG